MNRSLRLALAGLTVAAPLASQDVKVNALLIAWYTQMMDNNLRLNTAPAPAAGIPQTLSYYQLGGTKGTGTINPYNENGFSVRRMEIYVSAKITDEISGNVMFDPNQPTPILFDAFLTYKPSDTFEFKIGQFKPIGYESSMVPAADLLFTDRAQVIRAMTDYRDRGLQASINFGDKDFGGKVSAGVYNGDTSRTNDSNAQKDYVLRADFNGGTDHRFGFYAAEGETNKATQMPATLPNSFGAASATNTPPTAAEIYDYRDKTTTYGAYYYWTHGAWHFDGEAATGLLGRRFPSFLAAAAAAGRQHLDQKFLGYYASGAYTSGHHMVRLRYDMLNYNQGDKWYTTYNPYKESAVGVSRADGGDYTPKYTEITAGYTYIFKPDMVRKANLKLDYILRSKNFLAPRVGQTGEQGGDSIVGAFQVWF